MNTTQEPQVPEQVLTATNDTPPVPADAPAPPSQEAAPVDPLTSPAPITPVVSKAPVPEGEKPPRVAVLPLELRISGFGALEVNTDQGWTEVGVHRCFPWMEPTRFISLRVSEGEELALVRQLDDLTGPSHQALAASLQPATFAFEVRRIEAINKDLELRVWVVDTAQGLRTFETELDDWPREVAGGALLIQDVGGDLYRIADHTKLDAKSQKLLWAFLN
jgi:hypothetical protein